MTDVAEGFSAVENSIRLLSSPVLAWNLGKGSWRFGRKKVCQARV